MADDIYERIVFDGTFATFAEVARDFQDRMLTVNGVSKSFSMTGWRLGYAAGPAWLIAALEVLQSQSTSNPSSISQAAAVESLEGPQDFLEEWLTSLRAHCEIVLETIDATQGILAANEAAEPPSRPELIYAHDPPLPRTSQDPLASGQPSSFRWFGFIRMTV